MKKRFLCLLLSAILLSSCVQKGTNEQASSTNADTEAPSIAAEPLNIVQDGKSQYAIVVDVTNPIAKTFATTIQNLILKKLGAMLPLRDKGDAASYEYKILIGDVGVSQTDALKASTPAKAFAVKSEAKTLMLFAVDMEGFSLLEKYFNTDLFSDIKDGGWSLAADMHYLYDKKGDVQTMEFLKDGKTQYHLVFSSKELDSLILYTRTATYISQQTGLKISAVDDSATYENEILLGDVNRDSVKRIKQYYTQTGECLMGLYEGDFVIQSNDRFGVVMGAMKLIEYIRSASGESVVFSESENLHCTLADFEKNDLYAEGVALAQRLYGTYGSWIERQFTKMPISEQNDQKLVDALISRMRNSVAVCIGSSSALYDGFTVKLDRTDYSKVTKLSSNSHVLVATEFLNEYFGTTLSVDANGYADLTVYCEASSEYTLFYHASTGVVVITPKSVKDFSDLTAKIDGYTNKQYIERMDAFFHNPVLPEPTTNVEQTRIEIATETYDSIYVYDYTTEIYDCFASPAILTIGNTIYIAYEETQMSMENHGNKQLNSNTYVKKSTDGGSTWTQIGAVKDMMYGGLTELNGKIYLMGNRQSNGYVVICEYDPATNNFRYADLGFSVMGTAPTAIAIHNGRVWRAHNNAVISAPITSDLLKGTSWTKSESPNDMFTQQQFESATKTKVTGKFWLEEGNTVVGKDGQLYAIYRVDASPVWGYAVVFRVSEDGRMLTLVENDACVGAGIIEFPSGQSKFMIKYDEATGKYLSMTSIATNGSTNQRNVLALVASDDLFTWEIVDILLVERQLMNNTLSEYAHAFQYVDFDVMGDDLLLIVRESVGDSCNYHNANAITLYKLSDYVDHVKACLEK